MWVADVEQVAILPDETDLLSDCDSLFVELVHDIAVDIRELQGESLGELGIFAYQLCQSTEAVEHEMWVELEFQEFFLHLHVSLALLDDDGTVIEAEVDDGEQGGDGGKYIEPVSENIVTVLIKSVHHALEGDGYEDVGDKHCPAVQKKLGEGIVFAKQQFAYQIGDGERHQYIEGAVEEIGHIVA